jgi:hypothetical protein
VAAAALWPRPGSQAGLQVERCSFFRLIIGSLAGVVSSFRVRNHDPDSGHFKFRRVTTHESGQGRRDRDSDSGESESAWLPGRRPRRPGPGPEEPNREPAPRAAPQTLGRASASCRVQGFKLSHGCPSQLTQACCCGSGPLLGGPDPISAIQ